LSPLKRLIAFRDHSFTQKTSLSLLTYPITMVHLWTYPWRHLEPLEARVAEGPGHCQPHVEVRETPPPPPLSLHSLQPLSLFTYPIIMIMFITCVHVPMAAL
jgi:hypothetical protein